MVAQVLQCFSRTLFFPQSWLQCSLKPLRGLCGSGESLTCPSLWSSEFGSLSPSLRFLCQSWWSSYLEAPPGCCRVTHGPEDKDKVHFLCCLQLDVGAERALVPDCHPEMFLFCLSQILLSWLTFVPS